MAEASRAPERRLAAILAADIAGYARLMAMDEAATVREIRAHHTVILPLIRSFAGSLVDTAGDGILAAFPSAVRAVECALAIQQAMAGRNLEVPVARCMLFRIGVTIGDIIQVGARIYGDGVNIAARLQELAEPGGICISGTAHDHVQGKLACGFQDIGAQALKHIERPVRVFRVVPEPPGSQPAPPGPALPDLPSIAVLPFQNLSGEPEQDYFADGMVEDITTALSRIRQLFVIARNSSFTYKGRAVDVKQVGRELGVRYVLEGSVRKAGNRVRISGQLIDAATGAHLWAEHFDGELTDIFALQDQVAASVAGTIVPRLEQAEMERARRKPAASLDAYDWYLRGMAAFHLFTRPGHDAALAGFYRAIELDPGFAPAYGMAARCYMQRLGFGWVTDSAHEMAETERLARRASELGRDDAAALASAGLALAAVTGRVADGTALVERALALNPNLGWARLSFAFTRLYLGEPEEAIAQAALAMRLSPQDQQLFAMQTVTALGHLFAGRHDAAWSWAETASREQPSFVVALGAAAASAALTGRQDAAAAAVARLHQLNPALRCANLGRQLLLERAEDRALWAAGLRLAGLPE